MLALGLMSGTSLDGIDAALLTTDGKTRAIPGVSCTLPYDNVFKAKLRALLAGERASLRSTEEELTHLHAKAVAHLLEKTGLKPSNVDVIGFHGQTIYHNPKAGETLQIGDGALLAEQTGILVVNDFRSADVKAGGEGAPLVPVYHRALMGKVEKPVAVLNIGGVANFTWIGTSEDDLLAFDTGPGGALLDDWIATHTGNAFDAEGSIATRGTPDRTRLTIWLKDEYFSRTPPKSLDRNHFAQCVAEGFSLEDGAATLVEFTAQSIACGVTHFPEPITHCYVAGGGRHNRALMRALQRALKGCTVQPIETFGYNGDALEAEAFAFLAVRSLEGLPLTFPGTTGVKQPLSGGAVYPAGPRNGNYHSQGGI